MNEKEDDGGRPYDSPFVGGSATTAHNNIMMNGGGGGGGGGATAAGPAPPTVATPPPTLSPFPPPPLFPVPPPLPPPPPPKQENELDDDDTVPKPPSTTTNITQKPSYDESNSLISSTSRSHTSHSRPLNTSTPQRENIHQQHQNRGSDNVRQGGPSFEDNAKICHCVKNIAIIFLTVGVTFFALLYGRELTVEKNCTTMGENNGGPSNSSTTGLLEEIRARGELHCGIPQEHEGFALWNYGTEKYEGFDVDLVRM
jgi:hypothetical protein